MSFLYPLLLAGVTAVALPIVLHMIRRHTRKRVTFSSLMFLRTTAPRLRNRSRLEHIPLLILRCLIVCLLAMAFARPFLSKPIAAARTQPGKRIVLLLDTSASMRRAGMWNRAVEEARSVLEDVGPSDRVCLMTFDRTAQTWIGFEQWSTMDLPQRTPAVIRSLAETSPGWGATNLGQALIAAAETIEDDEVSDDRQAPGLRRIVLISDLQQGSDLSALLSYEWPEQVELATTPISCKETSNASAQLLTSRDPLAGSRQGGGTNVRIHNSADAIRNRFQLHWDAEPQAGREVYVPPGQGVVVQAPPRPASSTATRLVLTGDDHDFDNALHVAAPLEQQAIILYVGRDDPNDPKAMHYYVRQAFTASSQVTTRSTRGALTEKDLTTASLVVVADATVQTNPAALRRYLESGRTILLVLSSPEGATTLRDLTGIDDLECHEAEVGRYAMLDSIDFKHPLLMPFSDPRFGDFTRIHFWKHRRLSLADHPQAKVLARFDGDAPAWIEIAVGRGSLLVWTSGWHPSDSDLALSSKFVPLLYSILEQGGTFAERQSQYLIGDAVRVSAQRVHKPDGSTLDLDADGQAFIATNLPGIYAVQSPTGSRNFAVNLAPAESRTEPMAVEDLETMGISLGSVSDVASTLGAQAMQHSSFAQMESQQKLWRWILVAALSMLLIETWLGGWLTRSGPTAEGEQP
ncbi:MAG TPA: BatA domain-containing protein [Sedimentisphaerales bacterium]|nr:BatA domain-containing protein [Sedimentisphaerales bacterium]